MVHTLLSIIIGHYNYFACHLPANETVHSGCTRVQGDNMVLGQIIFGYIADGHQLIHQQHIAEATLTQTFQLPITKKVEHVLGTVDGRVLAIC